MPKKGFMTKSLFLAGMYCPLRLWYRVHRPELSPPLSRDAQFRVEAGQRVGRLACELYDDGQGIELAGGLEGAAARTRRLMEDESVPALFEATFEADGCLVRCDILRRGEGGGWELVEVKSGSSLKEEHYYDVWFQAQVLKDSGVRLNDASLAYVNKDCVFDGQKLDLDRFFVFQDLSFEIDGLNDVLREGLAAFRNIMAQDTPPAVEMSLK